jgi:hypothetical protein
MTSLSKESLSRMDTQLPLKAKNSHYEKLCPQQLDYPTTKAPKQLIYNYISIVPWKYDKLTNKISC